MSENILEELWYGNIDPHEQSYSRTPAIKELLELMQRNREKLYEPMTEGQRETLEKYDDCVNKMHCIVEQEIFAYAFRLGGKLMLAVMADLGKSE